MEEGNKILSRNIRQARRRMKMTQQQAADLLGMTTLHYGRLERAERRTSLEQLEDIARVFQVSPFALLEGCFKENDAPSIRPADAPEILMRISALLTHCTPEEQRLCYDICERIARGK